MGINWTAFVGGVADYTTERLKEERALKMKERLAELEDKYKQAAEIRAQNFIVQENKAKVAGTRQSADDPMMEEDVDVYGNVKGVRKRSAASIEAEAQARAKHEADLANIQSNIDYRNRSLDLESQKISAMREGNAAATAAAGGGEGRDVVQFHVDRLLSKLPLRDIDLANAPGGAKTFGRLETTARQIVLSALRSGDPTSMDDMFSRSLSTFNFDQDSSR